MAFTNITIINETHWTILKFLIFTVYPVCNLTFKYNTINALMPNPFLKPKHP